MIAGLKTCAVFRSPHVGEPGYLIALGALAFGMCAADDHVTPSLCLMAAISAATFGSAKAIAVLIFLTP